MMATHRKPVAVFISNLRELSDMQKLFPPAWHSRVQDARDNGPGYIASPPIDIMGRATGYLVLMLKSGAEVVGDMSTAAELVYKMTRYAAEDLDGDVIGLGSLTTSITKGGELVRELIDRESLRIRATHGDAGSTAAIINCLEQVGALNRMDQIAIVGAYGVIGSCLSTILSRRPAPVILYGRKPDKLSELRDRILKDPLHVHVQSPFITSDIRDIKKANYIVTVTSATDALIKPDMVTPHTVIVDPSVPANTHPDKLWQDPKHDVIVVSNASQLRMPGVAISSSMFGTYDDPDGTPTAYACFAETILNALECDREHHVGDIDPDFVGVCQQRFLGYGFKHAILRMFGADIEQHQLPLWSP